MKRLLFRHAKPSLTDYAAMVLVAVAFVAISIFVLAPERFAITENEFAWHSSN